MSSTSQQIDEAKKLAQLVKEGKQPQPASSGGASAEQLTTKTPQQPGIEIKKDAVVGGFKPESAPVVEKREAVPVVEDREIAPVVGKGQKHSLAKQFADPTVRAEEQTSLPSGQMTTAEKQTQIPVKQLEAADRISKTVAGVPFSDEEADKTTAAKQTKVPEKQEKSKVAKAQRLGEEYEGSSDAVDAGDAGNEVVDTGNGGDAGATEVTTTTVVEGDGNAGEFTDAGADVGGDSAVNDAGESAGGDTGADAGESTAGSGEPLLATKTTTSTEVKK